MRTHIVCGWHGVLPRSVLSLAFAMLAAAEHATCLGLRGSACSVYCNWCALVGWTGCDRPNLPCICLHALLQEMYSLVQAGRLHEGVLYSLFTLGTQAACGFSVQV